MFANSHNKKASGRVGREKQELKFPQKFTGRISKRPLTPDLRTRLCGKVTTGKNVRSHKASSSFPSECRAEVWSLKRRVRSSLKRRMEVESQSERETRSSPGTSDSGSWGETAPPSSRWTSPGTACTCTPRLAGSNRWPGWLFSAHGRHSMKQRFHFYSAIYFSKMALIKNTFSL